MPADLSEKNTYTKLWFTAADPITSCIHAMGFLIVQETGRVMLISNSIFQWCESGCVSRELYTLKELYTLIDGTVVGFTGVNLLDDYPWIRDVEHLRRVNWYRRRVGQRELRFGDDDMAELILIGRNK